MKNYIKSLVVGLFVFCGLFVSSSFAQEYIFFYGNGCSHCAKVEKFFEDENIDKDITIAKKEIYFNRTNLIEFNDYVKKLNLTPDQVGVPFLVINGTGESCTSLAGDKPIIEYFKKQLEIVRSGTCEKGSCDPTTCNHTECTHDVCVKQGNIVSKPVSSNQSGSSIEGALNTSGSLSGESVSAESNILSQRLKFFGIMMPAALADSINPCAFAVMLLLLSAILGRHKSKKKALLAGALFAFAVFLTYFVMGLGLFSALATMSNTFVLKLVVGILGILVGLANLKDYFWYGKFFVMEVPMSWRPKMQDIIYKVSSPWGAFFVGILVSLFLLPCSSGPYFTILGYLSAESKELHTWGYIYLLVYNLIFVLPMLIIAFMVAFGYSNVDKLAKIKHTNTKLIHLIVGLLMLGLGAYVLITL